MTDIQAIPSGSYAHVLATKSGNDIARYICEPQLVVPNREVAALETGCVEAIRSLDISTKTIPRSFTFAAYDSDVLSERFRGEANVAPSGIDLVRTFLS